MGMRRAAALTVVAFLWFWAIGRAQPVKRLEELKGKVVPDFPLRDLDGRVHPFARFRGKVVLLNFWSPY